MDRHDWQRIQALFHAALDLREEERDAYLAAESAGEPELLEKVRALLEEDRRVSALLDRPLAAIARDVLDDAGAAPISIGPYRIDRLLGEGGMGLVFLAERADLGSRAAVKMLRDAWISPARRERFHSEQRTLARLSHPAIARLFDADTLANGIPYIVMEYVEGSSITRHCAETGASVADRLRLFRQVCEAVRYAHGQAIIHRDLKPSNVLVTPDGSVKLLDFGIARQLDSVDLPSDPTRTGLRLMTPSYAAPEQLLGEPPGVYTDVYALGVLLYELLTGRLPHDLTGLTPAQVERRVLEEPVPSLQEAWQTGRRTPELRHPGRPRRRELAELNVIIMKALHRQPDRRYGTVDALIRDLDHFDRGEPLDARPDSLGYRAHKFVGRHRRGVAVAAGVALVLIGLTGFYTKRLAVERSIAQSEADKARVISDYLIGLFEASDPFETGNDSLDVRTLLARGEERAEALADQPDIQAEMLTVLGRVYTTLSDYDRAEPLLLRALEIRRLEAASPLELVGTLGALGQLYRYSGDYDQGETYAREALALAERSRPRTHPDVADALDNLGVIVAQRGNHQEGEELYRRALEIRRQIYPEPHVRLAHSLNNLGVNLANQGDYPEAVAYLREALEVGAVALGPDHASLATDMANLGVVFEILGDFAAADSMLTEAVRIKRRRLGDLHYETAFTLGQLGYVLVQAGDLQRARTVFQEALGINRAVLDPNHRDTGIMLINYSRALQMEGDLEGAEPLLREGLGILIASVGDDNEFTAITRCRLGELVYLRGRSVEAEELFNTCLAVLGSALPPGHDLLATLRSTFGAMLRREGRHSEAEPLLVAGYEALLEQFGPEHPQTRDAATRLRLLYEATGRLEEAERLGGREER